MDQIDLLISDIEVGINKVETAHKNGVALQSDVDNLKAELLKVRQNIIELGAKRKAYIKMLSHFINEEILVDAQFIEPTKQALNSTINRPELNLIELKMNNLKLQQKLIEHKKLPAISLFAQGGVGRPALNMLSNNVDPYYIGGLRFNWNFSNYYTLSNDKKIMDLNYNSLSLQKQVLIYNSEAGIAEQNEEITKAIELMKSDEEIIKLREAIVVSTQLQLENGTVSTNDYLKAINAKSQANHSLQIHHIQGLMAQYNYQLISGN